MTEPLELEHADDPPEDRVDVYVVPVPELAERGEALAGVPAAGKYVPAELADEWVDAGLVTLEDPPEPEDPDDG